MVKNPPAEQAIWARSLGWEGPLEKQILAWKIVGGLQSMDHNELDTT